VIHVYVMLQTVHVCLKQIQFLLLDQKALSMQHLKILVNYGLSYLIYLLVFYINSVNCLYIDNTIIVSSFIYFSLLVLVFTRVYWNTHTMYDRNDDIWKFILIYLIDASDRQIEWMNGTNEVLYKEKKKEFFMSSDILTVHTIGGCKCKWRNSDYTHYKTNMPIIG